MSKTNLIKEAEALIADVDKTHRYSMSKIYDLSNRVFKTKETPQSCASCLIRKVNELRNWVQAEKSKEAENPKEEKQPIESKPKRERRVK
nr:MAG TPA: hypothetical protein [Caudoviricetes sp.]